MFHIVIHYTSLYYVLYIYTLLHTQENLQSPPQTPHLLEHRTEGAPTENRAREKEDLMPRGIRGKDTVNSIYFWNNHEATQDPNIGLV